MLLYIYYESGYKNPGKKLYIKEIQKDPPCSGTIRHIPPVSGGFRQLPLVSN